KDIASYIRRQLKRRDWKQADLARESGIGSGRISEWMGGRGTPSPENCIRLAEAFNVDPDDLLALAGHRVPDRPLPPDDPRRELARMLNRIKPSPDRIAILRGILQTYLETDRESQYSRLVPAA